MLQLDAPLLAVLLRARCDEDRMNRMPLIFLSWLRHFRDVVHRISERQFNRPIGEVRSRATDAGAYQRLHRL